MSQVVEGKEGKCNCYFNEKLETENPRISWNSIYSKWPDFYMTKVSVGASFYTDLLYISFQELDNQQCTDDLRSHLYCSNYYITTLGLVLMPIKVTIDCHLRQTTTISSRNAQIPNAM
jgi:hypothetical protein